jgi:hypothetical protein
MLHKYLKYKNKYLSLKSQCQGQSQNQSQSQNQNQSQSQNQNQNKSQSKCQSQTGGMLQAKFKNKNQMPKDCSSYPIETMRESIWDNNGIGNHVEIKLRASPLGYIYGVPSKPNYPGFKPCAFESIKGEEQKQMDEPPQPMAQPARQPPMAQPARQPPMAQPARQPQMAWPPIAKPAGQQPIDDSVDIYIYGESDHTRVRGTVDELKQRFLQRGAFIFGEGLNDSFQQADLDDPNASFRTDILFASLYTKALRLLGKHADLAERTHRKRLNMLYGMMENNKMPPIEELREPWEKFKIGNQNDKQKIISDLQSFSGKHDFDFVSLCEYYFPDETMKTLLSISDFDAFNLMQSGSKHNAYGKLFEIITQHAREQAMVDRIKNKMHTSPIRPIVVFTGARHLDFLSRELSKEYKVRTEILY